MIYYLSGPVTILEPGLAVIECAGVGYGCRVTAYTAGQLKLNQNARLYISGPSGKTPMSFSDLSPRRSSAAMSC